MHHDVIIVGAGPAGSAAAITLAREGVDVLLIDRERFPRDKVCGDGLLPGSIKLLNQLGLADHFQSAGFNQINRALVISPEDKALAIAMNPREADTAFYIAPRYEFDTIIQQQAVMAGARFLRANVHYPLIESGRVKGVEVIQSGIKKSYRSRCLIGADGSSSTMAKILVPKTHNRRRRILWRRGYITGLEFDHRQVEFYFLKEIAPCGAWIFPVSETSANIGLGQYLVDYDPRKQSLNDLLAMFLKHPRIRPRLHNDYAITNRRSWYYHLAGWRMPAVAFDGAVLAGDAASFLDPFSGEGIHNALHSGIIAGEIISRALETGDCSRQRLMKYQARCQREIYRIIRRSLLIRKSYELFPGQVEKWFERINMPTSLAHKFFNRISTNFEFTGA